MWHNQREHCPCPDVVLQQRKHDDMSEPTASDGRDDRDDGDPGSHRRIPETIPETPVPPFLSEGLELIRDSHC